MLKLAIGAVVLCCGFVALLYVAQRRLQYFPERRRTALHHFIALRIRLLLCAKSQHIFTAMPVFWRLRHALARLTIRRRGKQNE